MKFPYYVKDLPSGGLIPPKSIKHYNRNNYYIELEGLTYKQVLEFEKDKAKVIDNKLKRLGVCIDHLIPDELKDYPISDMFCLMTYISILSSFDLIGDTEKSGNALLEQKPYYLSDIICPNCGKKYDRLPFNLSDIDFLKFPEELLNGKAVWKSVIKFNLIESYTFSIPTIREFREAIKEYLLLYEKEYENDNFDLVIRLIALSLSLNKYKENLKEEDITFETKFKDLKNLYDNAIAGDAMKLERIYRDLIQPVILISNYCDCKGGSVYDISLIITEILRQLKINSGRVTSDIYVFNEKLEHGSDEFEFQFSNRKLFPSHDEIRKRIEEEKRGRLSGNENLGKDELQVEDFYS